MNNKRKIFIGSRKSNLAKEQANLVIKKLKKSGLKNFLLNTLPLEVIKLAIKILS